MTHTRGFTFRPAYYLTAIVILSLLITPRFTFADSSPGLISLDNFYQQSKLHPKQTAVYVLEYGEESLLARAWLADHAKKSIDVQYFIWSSDNIGILAAEALLRAAERGVKVRVIVDDLLIDAPDETLLALAKHPNIEIEIYNPKHSVGTPFHTRLINMFTDFRGFNQRMHDKVMVVDDIVAITGGRNMEDKYFDYSHEYIYRDRDVLLLGQAAIDIQQSFERFWSSLITVPTEDLYDGLGIMQRHVEVDDPTIQRIYTELHEYARNPENFEPEVRRAIKDLPGRFSRLNNAFVWCDVKVINDIPGKNENSFSLGGGSRMASELAALVREAEEQLIIQSPYLILTSEAKALFRELIKRGVKIRIHTNSLASSDNMQAFSGYRNQRKALLKMGIEIYEFRPDAANQKTLMRRYNQVPDPMPTFSLHAKTVVIDSSKLFIGTFNLDPRSVNLNTETGVIIENQELAKQVEAAIVEDLLPENSWDASRDDPDSHTTATKRGKAFFWQLMPIKPIL
ncbi:phospholipase D family protein [Mariprofundus sp. KV]|uniref:phospholipase D family protein n=1 Tax=Mariprofundus sp. KV TaxID=2608715 RepID=UPI0015A429F1|nr:phospholipase D family protein [Mariprofundus sp. KV]NWF36984.1 phospholipase D family protein [Mariprofundus sp. KV]